VMLNSSLEHVIGVDLDMALVRVSASIQADCRLLNFTVRNRGFVASTIIGENMRQRKWSYFDGRREIPICAVPYEFGAEDWLYGEGHLVEEFWRLTIEDMINLFFEKNMAYQRAIRW
jgi:hypothetical protein